MATPIPDTLRRVHETPHTLVPALHMLGWTRFLQAQYALAEHRHPGAYEICHIVRGQVEWWALDRAYSVHPGEIYLTRPDEPHGGVDALMHPCELYWCIIAPEKARGPLWQDIIARLANVRERVFTAPETVPDAYRRLMAEHDAPMSDSPMACETILLSLMVELLRAEDAARSGRRRDRAPASPIAQAARWIEEHADGECSLEDAAAFAGLGLSRFHERFHAETGQTPGEHRARARIALAKRLLTDRSLSITTIAQRCGFSTSQYFATSFRRFTGQSPATFRRRMT